MKKRKVYYEPEDDVLNIWLSRESNKKIDYAEDDNGVIIHYTEDREPIYIEILDASRFFKSYVKPTSIKSNRTSVAIPHKIK